jgi:hypothetical protein
MAVAAFFNHVPSIVSSRSKPKVRWIHAPPVVAGVTDEETIRDDLGIGVLVGPPVAEN